MRWPWDAMPGDYNHDGRVDAADYTVWRNHLGEPDESNINHNGDGDDVGPTDYALWKQHFGEPNTTLGSGGLSETTVPEPAAGLALCWGLLLTGALRRAREPAPSSHRLIPKPRRPEA